MKVTVEVTAYESYSTGELVGFMVHLIWDNHEDIFYPEYYRDEYVLEFLKEKYNISDIEILYKDMGYEYVA